MKDKLVKHGKSPRYFYYRKFFFFLFIFLLIAGVFVVPITISFLRTLINFIPLI